MVGGSMENKYFIDDLAYDEAECEEKYDHKYLGQVGLRELIGIIKFHIRSLSDTLQSQVDGHEDRLSEIEERLANVLGSSEPIKLEDFVADTLSRLDEAEDRLNGIDDRLDNFGDYGSESSETFAIEDVVKGITKKLLEVEEHLNDVDTIELGSDILSVQEAVDLIEDQLDELGYELGGALDELEDNVVKSIEYNGEKFKPEDIYHKPQPEDQDIGYEKSSEGFVVVSEGIHHVIQAISNHCKYTKELDKGIIEYDFGARCLNEHDFLNREGYGFKLTLGNEVISMATGLKNATVIGEIDQDGFFISDTLKANGVLEVERTEEAKELELVWQLETPPLEDPTEVLQIVYTIKVPALGDDVYRENVITIPTDIDLSDATVRVGEGSEEERKSIKEAVDDLHKAIEDEAAERSQADQDLEEAINQLDGEAVKIVKVAGEPLEKDSEGAVNIERADDLMVKAGEEDNKQDLTVAEHLDALYSQDAAEKKAREAITERLDNIHGLFETSETDAFDLETILLLEHERLNNEEINRENADDELDQRIDDLLDKLGKIVQIKYEIVEELPEEGEPGVIYLVRMDSSEVGDNYYEEFIYLGEGSEGHFELIGSTRIDLSDLYEKVGSIESRLDNILGLEGYKFEEAAQDYVNRFRNFNDTDKSIETVISELSQELNNDTIKSVKVNGTELEKVSNAVNIPLVSQEYDGVVPKFNGVQGYLQDGDIILVMRNQQPTWTEVNIYELDPTEPDYYRFDVKYVKIEPTVEGTDHVFVIPEVVLNQGTQLEVCPSDLDVDYEVVDGKVIVHSTDMVYKVGYLTDGSSLILGLKGDTNLSGGITLADSTIIKSYGEGTDVLDDKQLFFADVNDDREVTSWNQSDDEYTGDRTLVDNLYIRDVYDEVEGVHFNWNKALNSDL